MRYAFFQEQSLCHIGDHGSPQMYEFKNLFKHFLAYLFGHCKWYIDKLTKWHLITD